MFIKNQFIQNKLVLHLMEKEQFELLSLSVKQEEYLLWKSNKRKTDIIRVSLKQHDWRRDLVSSIENIEKKTVEKIQIPLFQERISFHHVFITDYEPVDSWKALESSSGHANKISNSYAYIFVEDIDTIDRLSERILSIY